MSVLKVNRKESRFEVFHHFYEVRKELTELIFRNFGYKGTDDFQKFIINGTRVAIMENLKDAQKHITIANSIFPTFIWECDERRKEQDIAIGLMYDLLQEIQFLLQVVTILDKNKFIRYADSINQEINLLKGWRQSDNATRKKIQGNI